MFSGKVVIGLIIFIVLFSLPLLYSAVTGNRGEMPALDYPTGVTECVAGKEYMRSNHMDLLNEWRDEVVRNQKRLYTAENGTEYVMSLSNTCLGCHSSEKFCKRCHDHLAVSPYCWECHVEREESL